MAREKLSGRLCFVIYMLFSFSSSYDRIYTKITIEWELRRLNNWLHDQLFDGLAGWVFLFILIVSLIYVLFAS